MLKVKMIRSSIKPLNFSEFFPSCFFKLFIFPTTELVFFSCVFLSFVVHTKKLSQNQPLQQMFTQNPPKTGKGFVMS